VTESDTEKFEGRVLLGFVVVSTIAMVWITLPFFGAILWALVATIVFAPVTDRLALRMRNRRGSAAGLTLLLIIAIVIVPMVIIGSLLIDEALGTYDQLRTRQIDFGKIFADVQAGLPGWASGLIERFGLGDLDAMQRRFSVFVGGGLRVAATQALSVGQSAFGFVVALGIMLYLTFFLLRDGRQLTRRIGDAVPLRPAQRGALFDKFTTVIRATIKGSIVVAIVQGLIGGLIFWILGIDGALLWGVVMGLLSLLPAIGTALIWAPVAIYLFATGDAGKGTILVLCGVLIIGMVDNVLRPILVGKDTAMPDYVVLIATLGGIGVMGINGFIVGPVIAAMFIAAWEIFTEARAAPAEA
jgi:predicted PurR-regulated permease PerM